MMKMWFMNIMMLLFFCFGEYSKLIWIFFSYLQVSTRGRLTLNGSLFSNSRNKKETLAELSYSLLFEMKEFR